MRVVNNILLTAGFLLFAMTGAAQYPNGIKIPTEYDYFRVAKTLGIPNDTFAVPTAVRGFPHIAFKDAAMYRWDTTAYSWTLVETGSSTTITNLGSSYRLWDPVTPGLKTLAAGTGITLDSTTANTITITGVQRFGVSGEDVTINTQRNVDVSASSWLQVRTGAGGTNGYWGLFRNSSATNLASSYYTGETNDFNKWAVNADMSASVGIDYNVTKNGGNGSQRRFQVNSSYIGFDYGNDSLSVYSDMTITDIHYRLSHSEKLSFAKNTGGSVGNDYLSVDFVNGRYLLGNTSKSYLDIYDDSISLKPFRGILNIDSLATVHGSDTANYKIMARNSVTGQVKEMTYWPSGGGGGSQNLQQVLDAGSTLTSSETIEVGANILSIYSSSTSSTVLDVYNANTGTGAFGITSYTEGGMAIAGGTNGANTNTPIRVGEFEASSTGTTAAGFGGFIGLALEHSTGAVVDAGSFGWNWTNPALASKTTNFTIKGFDSGVEETFMKIEPVYTIVNNGADTLSTMAYARSVGGGGGGSGTVTDFIFTDGSGFDGTVTTSTSTPTLSLTTTVSNGQIMYSNSGAITGDADITRTGAGAFKSTNSITSASHRMNNYSSIPSAMVDEVSGEILTIGINVTQVGTQNNARAGGIFRFDTRSSDHKFVVFGKAAGSSALTELFSADLNDNEFIIGSTDNGSQIFQVNGTSYFSAESQHELQLKIKDITEPSTPSAGYGALFTNSDKLKFKSDGGTVYTLENMGAGTYTPTNTNIGNIDAVTIYDLQYLIIGTIVHVSGAIGIDATSSGTVAQVDLSLPIASNFTSTTQANGVVVEDVATTTVGSGTIASDATNDRIQIRIMPSGTGALAYRFYFTYQVL